MLVLGKVVMQFVLVVEGLLGNRPPVQVYDPTVAGVPVQPAIPRLTGLRQLLATLVEQSCVAPAFCSAVIASIMLVFAPPPAMVWGEPAVTIWLPMTLRAPS